MRLTYTSYDVDKGARKRLRSGITGMLAAILLAPGLVVAFGNIFESEQAGVADPVVTEIVDSAVKSPSEANNQTASSQEQNAVTAGEETSTNNQAASSQSGTGSADQNTLSASPYTSSFTSPASRQSSEGMGGDPDAQPASSGSSGNTTNTDPIPPSDDEPIVDEPDDPLNLPLLDTVDEVGGAIGLPVLIDKSLRLRRKKR